MNDLVIKHTEDYFDSFVQDCSNSIANALELLSSYPKPSICNSCNLYPMIHLLPLSVQIFFLLIDTSQSVYVTSKGFLINSLRQRQNGRHFPDNIFRYIFVNENVCISIKISLKFVP